MKSKDHFGRISLFVALAVTLLTCIRAHGQSVPLFDAPAQSAVSPEIPLFDAPPSPLVASNDAARFNLFDTDSQPLANAAHNRTANSGPISPKSGLPDHAPIAILLPAPTLTDSRNPPLTRTNEDDRPVVHAYSIARCIPCNVSKESTGSGDARVKVEWHHSPTGEMHPYAVHVFGLKHGYPVYRYQSPKGNWELTSGGRTMDAVAELVGKSDSQIVNR